MLILKSPPVVPTMSRSVVTLTVSFASNGFEGTNETPLPSGWASSLPGGCRSPSRAR